MKTKLFATLLLSTVIVTHAQDNNSTTNKDSATKEAGNTNVIRLVDGTIVPPLKPNTNQIVLTNLTLRASYAMGLQTAGTMFMQDFQNDLDVEAFVAGFRDVFGHCKPMIPPTEVEEILKSFEKFIQIKQEEKNLKTAEENKTRGEKFLEENKNKEGVVTTKSGLQYKVIQEGAGDPPDYEDNVAIHFSGKTIDGIQFSTSYKHKEPAVVPLRAQIAGFREALQMMKPGAKWQLFIPAKLAYREREVARGVGPNSTLVFELELVRIVKGGAPTDSKKPVGAEAKK